MAARPYWKGYLKLSLVSCAVALYPATSSSERVSFNQLNRHTGNRIKYKKVDADTGDEVEQGDIIKGYQVDKNVYVQFENDELEDLQVESTHTIEIDNFVPKDQIDARFFDAPYYIVANDKVGYDAFAVIREAMKGEGTVGVGRVVLSKREHPIILEPDGKGIRATTLLYPNEVRDSKEFFEEIPDVKISGEMLQLAKHIVKTKLSDFEPQKFEDHYENAVLELIKTKQSGKAITKGKTKYAPPPQGSNIIDLLKKSLEMGDGRGKKAKAPSLVPDLPKTRKKARA